MLKFAGIFTNQRSFSSFFSFAAFQPNFIPFSFRQCGLIARFARTSPLPPPSLAIVCKKYSENLMCFFTALSVHCDC